MLEVMTSCSLVKARWPEKMGIETVSTLNCNQLVRQAEVNASGSSP